MSMNRSRDWINQAAEDWLWAEDTLASKRWAQACFVSQQCAEKALKAVALSRGFDRIKSHSILDITKALGINGDIEAAAKKLDLYYMTTRYPDALPAGAPFEYFTKDQAEEAVALAKKILECAHAELKK